MMQHNIIQHGGQLQWLPPDAHQKNERKEDPKQDFQQGQQPKDATHWHQVSYISSLPNATYQVYGRSEGWARDWFLAQSITHY